MTTVVYPFRFTNSSAREIGSTRCTCQRDLPSDSLRKILGFVLRQTDRRLVKFSLVCKRCDAAIAHSYSPFRDNSIGRCWDPVHDPAFYGFSQIVKHEIDDRPHQSAQDDVIRIEDVGCRNQAERQIVREVLGGRQSRCITFDCAVDDFPGTGIFGDGLFVEMFLQRLQADERFQATALAAVTDRPSQSWTRICPKSPPSPALPLRIRSLMMTAPPHPLASSVKKHRQPLHEHWMAIDFNECRSVCVILQMDRQRKLDSSKRRKPMSRHPAMGA